MHAICRRFIVSVVGALTILTGGTSVAVAEPDNIGDLKAVATEYYDSGAYFTDLQQAAAPAIAWINDTAPTVERPAVVFDIDETALSNWDAIKANDFGRIIDGPCTALPIGPCGWRSWDLLARSSVIPSTLDIYHAAAGRGAAIFFITGRDETQRTATETNLTAAGYRDYARLIMEPIDAQYVSAADFKAPQRAQIERDGYTIIANIGDQPSDLAGGSAAQTFLLPNPFYRIP
jgi:predicted secreted acid phosphatase